MVFLLSSLIFQVYQGLLKISTKSPKGYPDFFWDLFLKFYQELLIKNILHYWLLFNILLSYCWNWKYFITVMFWHQYLIFLQVQNYAEHYSVWKIHLYSHKAYTVECYWVFMQYSTITRLMMDLLAFLYSWYEKECLLLPTTLLVIMSFVSLLHFTDS